MELYVCVCFVRLDGSNLTVDVREYLLFDLPLFVDTDSLYFGNCTYV